MHDTITEWINLLKVSRRTHTVQRYEYLLRTLAKTAPDRRARDWTTEQLLAYLAHRRDAGLGDSGVKMIVCAMRGFFGWLYGLDSPARRIPYPKIKKRLQRTLDSETMFAVLASCDTSKPVGIRDLAILSLMLDSGLRAFEICGLELDKVDVEGQGLKVIVKGGREERGVFSKTTAAYLARWLAVRPYFAAPDTKTFFVSMGGGSLGKPLTTNGLRVVFRYIRKRAGLKAFSPHDMRRTFATMSIRNGAPTRVVQAAGRWNDIAMVERYTAAIQPEDFEPYSPVESLITKGNSKQ